MTPEAVELLEKSAFLLLGGLLSFAWSQVTQGHRLTRLETKVDAFPASIDEKVARLKAELSLVAGRRALFQEDHHG